MDKDDTEMYAVKAIIVDRGLVDAGHLTANFCVFICDAAVERPRRRWTSLR